MLFEDGKKTRTPPSSELQLLNPNPRLVSGRKMNIVGPRHASHCFGEYLLSLYHRSVV